MCCKIEKNFGSNDATSAAGIEKFKHTVEIKFDSCLKCA